MLKRLTPLLRCITGLSLAWLAGCTTATQTQTASAVCVSVSEQFYQADRLGYEMDFANAESGYVQLQAFLRSQPEAAGCDYTPSEARLAARIANMQSAQLQFLSASEMLRQAHELAEKATGVNADLDR